MGLTFRLLFGAIKWEKILLVVVTFERKKM